MLKGIGLIALSLAIEGAFLFHAALPAGVRASAPAAAPASAGVLARNASPALEAAPADGAQPQKDGGAQAMPCNPATALDGLDAAARRGS